MNIRFYNALLLPMAGEKEPFPGELWVEGDRIAFAGPSRDAAAREPLSWDRQVDAAGDLLMPGFCNAHTHSSMTFLRGRAEDLPLQSWLNQVIFPREARLTQEDAELFASVAFLEYLAGGITSCFDMYLFPYATARAAVRMGMRAVLCGSLNNFTGSLSWLEESYQELNRFHPLVSFRLGFHGEYTTSRELLEGVADLSHRWKAPVFTHNSETKGEAEDCLSRTGKTPTAYLDSLGLFDYGGGGFHCVHLSRQDLDIFREKRLFAVTCPGSNSKLASGIAPLTEMEALGIPLAIGTDGPASNNALDLFREMYLACVLQKLRLGDAAAMKAGRALWMATAGGADAMGLRGCGRLLPGKKADVIRINLSHPNLQPVCNIPAALVFSGNSRNVSMTMIDGRILYEDGRYHLDEDPAELLDRAARSVKKIEALLP